MTAVFHVIIPARYASLRLPGKPLLEIAGKPMIQHVYDRARQSGAASVTVATDDDTVAATLRRAGCRVEMTGAQHRSGTDRIAEAAALLGLAQDSVIVNVQGDEPDMPPRLIDQVAQLLVERPLAHAATACAPLENPQQLADPDVVKVVRDAAQRALYFSRAAIPHRRGAPPDAPDGWRQARRHIGIYAYRNTYLQHFSRLGDGPLERLERLEQLRILWHGDTLVCCDAVAAPGAGVDTPADLQHARERMAAKPGRPGRGA